MIQKNTAGQFLYFVLLATADGSAVTGASPAGVASKDGAVQGAVTGSFTERGNGQYEFAMSQADTNADEVGFLFTAATAVAVNITISTETKKMADLNDIAAGAAMSLEADAITASVYDETTAYPIASADTGASQIARVGADGDTLESLSDEIAALPDAAGITTQTALALSNIHLDHLLGVTYDPASKPGVADALLNEIIGNDAGVSQFTANALELAPGAAGDATAANQVLILEDLADIEGTGFAKDTDSLVDLAKPADIPDAAAIETACDASLVTIQLDHLLAVAYAGTGAAGSLLEDLTVDNAGTYEFTTAALQNAPSGTGGDATAANQVLLLEDLADVKGTGFVKDTDSLVDVALSSELAAVDTKIDGIDTVVDSILVDTGTTLPASIATIDGVVDFVQQVLEGDRVINDAVTPWRLQIKDKTTKAVLVEKEMFEVNETTNITAVTGIVGAEIEPV